MSELELLSLYEDLTKSQSARELLSNPLLKKDVWSTVSDLGLKLQEHFVTLTLNFQDFYPEDFKLLAKLHILSRVRRKDSIITISGCTSRLKKFSYFLKSANIFSIQQVNNQILEEFLSYLKKSQVAEVSIAGILSILKIFFDDCRLSGWLKINTYWFLGRSKRIKIPKNDEINYIPEEVWNQLDENLHNLPEQLQRMILVIRTTGIRGGELLNLPFDCLRARGNQWRLRFNSEKYNIEDELPIIPDLVVVIKEQQSYIKKHFNHGFEKLFCGNTSNPHFFKPKPEVMSLSSFNRWLNVLAHKCNICASSSQEPWNFTSHQFRRTVATIMTNAGVRDLIIQKYLRHRSPDMQRHYKHILQQVLGEEYQELMKEKKYVDISGKVIASYKPNNPVTELMRRKMHQITTQYGECHRPNIKEPCQTVNACWRCEHWQTSTDDLSYLHEDLERLNKEILIAEQLGMIRQHQGLIEDYKHLATRIQGLEKINDSYST
jgi:integrase/recombinase XerD